jgi:hypothetical protein
VALHAADDLRFDGGVAAELRRAQSISTGGVTTMKDFAKGFLPVTGVLIVCMGITYSIYRADQTQAAMRRADDAQIAALNGQLADVNQRLKETTTAWVVSAQAYEQCQDKLAGQPTAALAPESDPDFVTVIVSQSAPSAAPASADASAAPIVALGNLLRPGLGTMLGNLAPPQTAPSFAPPAFVRWIVLGKVTPYISPGTDVTLTKYAWINVKTQAIEAHDPRPARELVEQLHAQGMR